MERMEGMKESCTAVVSLGAWEELRRAARLGFWRRVVAPSAERSEG